MRVYYQGRPGSPEEVVRTTESTKKDVARLQSLADRTGKNEDFARRMQSVVDGREAMAKKSKYPLVHVCIICKLHHLHKSNRTKV